jgi:hypothetical protein
MFNILEAYLDYLYYSLRSLSRIISNTILLVLYLIELLYDFFSYIANHGISRSLSEFLI